MPKLFRHNQTEGEEVHRLSRDRTNSDASSNGFGFSSADRQNLDNINPRRRSQPVDSIPNKSFPSEQNNNIVNTNFVPQDHISKQNTLLSSIKSKTRVGILQNFQFPDDISIHRPNLRNILSAKQQISLDNHPLEISITPDPRQIIQDEEDIMKMAAQRDQRRGSMRSARGMMGPILSKTDNNLQVPQSRSLIKQRSESSAAVMGSVHEYQPMESSTRNNNINQTSYDLDYPDKISIVHPKTFNRQREANNNQISPQRDIMNQSIRRQNLKQFRHSIHDVQNTVPSVFSAVDGIGNDTDFKILRLEKTQIRSPWSNVSKDTNAHDDVQILNLHGFMDGIRGVSSVDSRKRVQSKSKDVNPGRTTSRLSRTRVGRTKKRNSRREGSLGYEDDNDVVLKDIDYIEDKVSSIIIDGKVSKQEYRGKPITLDQALALRQMLTGNSSSKLSEEWLSQSFLQNRKTNLSYGLVQKKGGPCGVLASVQAQMIKNLVFGSNLSPKTSPASPLRPSSKEWSWALTTALAEILSRIGQGKAIVALPGSFAHFSDYGGTRYTPDGLTETLFLHEASDDGIIELIKDHLTIFTNERTSGCVLFLYSALLTRGIDGVTIDMDAGGSHLINVHGYASQEVVNLLLTGQAITNTFDGDHTLGNDDQSETGKSEDSQYMTLKGIQKRSEIGLLSLFEHYGSCKVGKHLKTPEYPVWVVCSESHYSVIFSRDKNNSSNTPPSSVFDLYYYDGLAMLEDEVKLTVDLDGEPTENDPVPPLELCIRTKWHRAGISWNGTDPIL